MMKKITFMFITIICVACFCVHPFAIYTSASIITIDNIDVIFDNDSSLSTEEKQTIAEYLVNGTTNVQTYGLICNVFGHKNSTEYVTTITHCAYSTAPRCLDEQWEIVTCSRCNNTETTRIAFSLVDCCPED